MPCSLIGSQPAIDEAIQRWVATHHRPWLDRAALLVTQLGGTPLVLTVTVAVALLSWRRARAARRSGFATVVLCVAGELAVELLARAMKAVIGRPRPPLRDAVVVLANSSLPAAHVSRAAYAGCLAVATRHTGPAHRWAMVALVAAVAAVAASRVVLGTHWFTDTLVAIPVGLLAAWWPATRLARQALNDPVVGRAARRSGAR